MLLSLCLILFLSTFEKSVLGTFSASQIIEEHGTIYKQKVEFDPETKALSYEVPSHNNVDASIVIIHKQSNTMMLKDPIRNICMLSSAPQDFNHPELSAMAAFETSANNETLTPKMAKKVFLLNANNGQISEIRKLSLIPAMRDLCQGCHIESIDQIEVSEEEFKKKLVDPELRESTNGTRAKRASFFVCDKREACSDDPNFDGIYCSWRITSKTVTKMELSHIQSANFKCVACCYDHVPGHPMCRCSSVNNSNFRKCQGITG